MFWNCTGVMLDPARLGRRVAGVTVAAGAVTAWGADSSPVTRLIQPAPPCGVAAAAGAADAAAACDAGGCATCAPLVRAPKATILNAAITRFMARYLLDRKVRRER